MVELTGQLSTPPHLRSPIFCAGRNCRSGHQSRIGSLRPRPSARSDCRDSSRLNWSTGTARAPSAASSPKRTESGRNSVGDPQAARCESQEGPRRGRGRASHRAVRAGRVACPHRGGIRYDAKHGANPADGPGHRYAHHERGATMKYLSRHDDRPGSMVGLVYLWDQVSAVIDYMESDPSLTPAWWHAMALQGWKGRCLGRGHPASEGSAWTSR